MLGSKTLGSCGGKDETTRFQNDAVRDDLRLGAKGKQVVEQLGREAPGGRGRREEFPVQSLQTLKLGEQ